MTEDSRRKKTDLVLSNGEYAFTQDSTTGSVKVLTGPTVVNVTGQESPVLYDTDPQRFVAVDLEDAAKKSPLAPQGFYIELRNPAENGVHPHEGSKEAPPSLLMGQRENIPGPTTFSLWPQQVATVIEGHRLRSNQYVLCRVYDEEAAKANWQKAVLKETAGAGDGETQGTISELTEEDLAVGRLFVIKGTQASFYIPPTGVEVVPDEAGAFVRNALTLERLQYCILVDENGDKDYQRGPKVVFPKPTQRFFEDSAGGKVFKPTELNPIQGIHVKVIAAYEEDGRRYEEGEELFITGKDTSIYFPRPEHSLIRYDGSAKHFATAVPEGEARYVMDRNTGVIRTVAGPTMLLPDPRTEVIVRRVLGTDECSMWYPDNDEARRYNQALWNLLKRTPSTRSAVSEGEVRRSKKGRGARDQEVGLADKSTVSSGAAGAVADEWMRAATFTEPRSLMLDTRYAGVPAVRPFTGYAVMVVNKRGERRVVRGPANVLLEYDETLEVFEASMGMPKSEASKERQVYLRLRDNRVDDRVKVVCRDHIAVSFDLALRVDFEGEDMTRWFEVSDWCKLLCDFVRRRLRDAAQNRSVESVWKDPASFARAAVFDGDLPRHAFDENAMVLVAVEVESAQVLDKEVATMLRDAELGRVSSTLEAERAQTELEREREAQSILRAKAEARAETERFEAVLDAERIARQLSLAEAQVDADIKALTKKGEEQTARDELEDARQAKALSRKQRAAELDDAISRGKSELSSLRMEAETRAAVARFEAAQGPLAEAIQLLGNQEVLARVAEAVSAQRLLGGKDAADVVSKLFEGTPLQSMFAKVERAAAKAPL
ncbi:MAG: hypothetical protein AAFV29_02165, partial [Myxococcota bacterium]